MDFVRRTVAFLANIVQPLLPAAQPRPAVERRQAEVEGQVEIGGRNSTVHIGDIIQHFGQEPEVDIDRLGEKLQRKLKEHNNALIGSRQYLPVPPDIIREQENTREEFGRSGLRQLLTLNLGAIFYTISQLFTAAKTEAEERARVKTTNQAAREKYVKEKGNIVGVVGIAGIGKTTLGHQHLELVTQAHDNMPETYEFHISLRDFDYKANMNVMQFLLMSSIPNWKHDPVTDKALLEKLDACPNVLIIMDALDEAKMENVSLKAPDMNLYDCATPEVIFKNLSSGHLLPNAHKMVISRPKAFHQLAAKSKPLFVVKSIGLGEESQQLLFKRMCCNQAEFNEINRQLSLNPIIKALCFVPVFLKLFTPYAKKHQDGGGVYSLADVFSSFLEDCVTSEHFRPDPSELYKLFTLAITGTCDQKYLFDENDMSKHDIQLELVDSFLNLQIKVNESRVRILAGHKKYFFSHLNWQEYFSALHLMYFLDLSSNLDTFHDLTGNDQWEVVMRFLFGLTNPIVHENVVGIFPSLADHGVHHQSQVSALQSIYAKMAYDYSSSVQDFTAPFFNLTDYNSYQQWNDFLSQPSDFRLLKLCGFAFESKDPKITETIVNAVPDKIVLKMTILPSDVLYLCHILQKTTKEITFVIGYYHQPATFTGQGLKMFLKSIKGKILKFHISNVKVDVEDLELVARHIPHIKELGFTSCNLTSQMFNIISDALMRRSTPISVFELSSNQVDADCIFHITRCLEMITRLDFLKMQFSIGEFRRLTSNIAIRHEPLKWFAVSENHLGPLELQCLANCVHQLEILTMCSCRINGPDIKPLTDAIGTSNRKIRWLDFRDNAIGIEGLDCIADCVGNVEVLIISRCDAGGNDLKKLTQTIAALDNPMVWLQVSGNCLQESGVAYLSGCIRNVQSLSMMSCNLNDKQLKVLCQAISKLNERMGLLDITFNHLGDKSARYLASCLHNITRLEIKGCNFTEHALQFIRSSRDRHRNRCVVDVLEDELDSSPSSDQTTPKGHQ